MVLGSQGPGRVGRRRFFLDEPPFGRLVFVRGARSGGGALAPPAARASARERGTVRALRPRRRECGRTGRCTFGDAPTCSPRSGGARCTWQSARPTAPDALGPPALRAAREAMKSGAPGEERLAGGAPVLPDRAPRASGPSVCRAMNRLAAGLGARGDHAGPARALLTSEPPAVRVRADGGGGLRGPATRGRWGRRVRPCGAERCLAQRRELQCRSQGTAHQLAQGARAVSACRQAGEHVFGKVGVGSDGTGPRDTGASHRIWLWRAIPALPACKRTCTAPKWRSDAVRTPAAIPGSRRPERARSTARRIGSSA